MALLYPVFIPEWNVTLQNITHFVHSREPLINCGGRISSAM